MVGRGGDRRLWGFLCSLRGFLGGGVGGGWRRVRKCWIFSYDFWGLFVCPKYLLKIEI